MPRWLQTFEERFWAKVDKSGGPDACWPWIGGCSSNGYGQFHVGLKGDGTRLLIQAHRVAYELAHGPLGPGECSLHRCDNPPCCNERHLFKGTKTDNMRDSAAKGRNAMQKRPWRSFLFGKKPWNAKKSEDDDVDNG